MINWSKYAYKVEGKKTSRRKTKYVNPSYNVEDLFRHFRQSHANSNKLKSIKQPLFKEIISEYNKVVSDYIIKGFIVKLPFGLGELGVKKRKLSYDKAKIKNLRVNFKFLEKGKPWKYHLNEHSNSWQASFFWSKRHARIENQTYYSFKASPRSKKALAKVMLSPGGYLNYYEPKPFYPKPKI